MENNIALNATNPRITGNVKIVLDSEGQIFFESINSSDWLSRSTFKGYKYNKNLLYRTNLRNFVNQSIGLSRLYDIVDTNKISNTNDMYQQYHYLYDRGCYSEESQIINENFRFFSPIHIKNTEDLPSNFVVLKTYVESNDLSVILENDFKLVKSFDLYEINKLIFSTIVDSGLSTDLNDLKIYGYDIETSNSVTKYEKFNQLVENEQTIIETNNWLTNSFKRNNMIYGNIINMEFAFTDDDVDGKFVRYVGLYVNTHEHQSIEKLDGSLRMIKSSNGNIQYDKNHQLQKYFGRTFSINGNSFGVDKHALLEINMLINPAASTLLQFMYNGIVDCSIVIESKHISSNVDVTRRNIARLINSEYNGENSTIRAEVLGKTIRLLTNNFLDDTETLTFFSTSSSMKIKQPLFGNRQNTFAKPNKFSILSSDWLNTNVFTHIKYVIDDVVTYTKIVEVNEYLGQYMYVVEDAVPESLRSGDVVWLTEELTEKAVVCSILPIGELDCNTEINNYKNMNDFDKAAYLKYLLDEIYSENFIGNAVMYFGVASEIDLTAIQLSAYKKILFDKVEQYVYEVEQNDKPFIKSINSTTLISEMLKSPYERFEENMQESLRNVNRLYPFINKWSSGKDSSNNDNIFNVSLPWKHESLNASHVEIERNMFKNSHDWFVLVDGLPPYDLPHNQKASFSAYSLDSESFKNVDIDAYEYLQHKNGKTTTLCYATIEYDNLQKSSFVYFKGVKYRIEKQLEGYKFAVVVKTSEALLDDVFKIEAIQNDKFKTYTVYINFYVPEPILTSLERSDKYYYIDKSLMYYSNEIYSTIENAVDFGVDKISLDLYNSKSPKTYLGQELTHTNWYHEISNDETLLYVKRGNSGIFGTKFVDIISIGGNLKIKFTSTDDIDSPWYGMIIEFINIVEISINHFWCKQIVVKYNTSTDTNNDDNEFLLDDNISTFHEIDIFEQYTLNNNLFIENNIAYMSKSIAYELCYYDKVVTKSGTNSRYSELSMANIKQYLKSNNIKNSTSFDKLSVEDMFNTEITITNCSEYSENNELHKISTLKRQYSYAIRRQNLMLKPLIIDLQNFYDFDNIKNVFPLPISTSYRRFKKIVSKIDNEYLDKLHSIDFEPIMNLNEYYDYVKAFNNESAKITMPWLISPDEIRTPIASYVMNTSEKIVVVQKNNLTNTINLVDVLKSYILQIVNVDNVDKSVLNEYINIYTNSTLETIKNYNVVDVIIDKFIQNVFTKIYRLESAIDANNVKYDFSITNSTVFLNNIFDSDITLTFTR